MILGKHLLNAMRTLLGKRASPDAYDNSCYLFAQRDGLVGEKGVEDKECAVWFMSYKKASTIL